MNELRIVFWVHLRPPIEMMCPEGYRALVRHAPAAFFCQVRCPGRREEFWYIPTN